jgi:hypothetical protein
VRPGARAAESFQNRRPAFRWSDYKFVYDLLAENGTELNWWFVTDMKGGCVKDTQVKWPTDDQQVVYDTPRFPHVRKRYGDSQRRIQSEF